MKKFYRNKINTIAALFAIPANVTAFYFLAKFSPIPMEYSLVAGMAVITHEIFRQFEKRNHQKRPPPLQNGQLRLKVEQLQTQLHRHEQSKQLLQERWEDTQKKHYTRLKNYPHLHEELRLQFEQNYRLYQRECQTVYQIKQELEEAVQFLEEPPNLFV